VSHRASCPQCGGEIVFSLDASLLKICESCGSAIARKGADLSNYGKVAELVSTGSLLRLGIKGDYEGAPPFTLVGRLQLSTGSGTWDEWLMAFQGGTWAWLSESQGKFHYMGQTPLPPLPRFEELRVGATIDLGRSGTFVVTESREGRFVSGEGELPFDTAPGSKLRYADLQGPGGQFSTIDYGTGSSAEAVYVGREVSLDELGFMGLKKPEAKHAAAKGAALSCPQCAGPLELRAPDETQRIACPYCGSLLDAKKDLKVIEVMTSVPVKPLIPLGAKGRLFGAQWTLIGFMERSVEVEGVRYAWREYLLHEAKRGFRWLTESKGHWSFVDPVHAGDVTGGFGGGLSYEGESYKHFQSGFATVDHVLGEFYWAVARGDTTETHDYVHPPRLLSEEKTESEASFSLVTYLEPEEVWRAFALRGKPPAKSGVAPNQPWPRAQDARPVFTTALLLASAVVVLFLLFSIVGGRRVLAQTYSLSPRALSGSPESAVFSERFAVPRWGNLEVRVDAPVDNSWLYLDGALIDEASGDVHEFDAEVAYYTGVDSDGAWSEGGPHARTYLGGVRGGEYVLRLLPQWEAGKMPSSYTVTLRSGVPRLYQVLLALLLILLWPALLVWSKLRFEAARWSESDHPWASVSGEGDDE